MTELELGPLALPGDWAGLIIGPREEENTAPTG